MYRGTIGGKEAVLAQSGIGKVAASSTTQLLIDRFEVKSIVFSGVAGSLDLNLRVGDLVVATELFQYDVGILTPEDFKHLGSGAYDEANRLKFFKSYKSDPELVETALKASDSIEWSSEKPKIVRGPIATGDQVVFSQEIKAWLNKTFGALAVETEGAAVAQVASMYGIPFLVIRAISDTIDFPEIDLSQIIPEAGESSLISLKRVIKYLALHPSNISKVISLARNIKLSSHHSSLLTLQLAQELP